MFVSLLFVWLRCRFTAGLWLHRKNRDKPGRFVRGKYYGGLRVEFELEIDGRFRKNSEKAAGNVIRTDLNLRRLRIQDERANYAVGGYDAVEARTSTGIFFETGFVSRRLIGLESQSNLPVCVGGYGHVTKRAPFARFCAPREQVELYRLRCKLRRQFVPVT